MPILKLARLNDHGEPLPNPQTLHVNFDNVEVWRGGTAGVTTIYTVSGKTWVVAISAGELAAAIDPENVCSDPAQIADDAIGLFLEYRDQHGHDEDTARALALRDMLDGLSVDVKQIEREMRGVKRRSGSRGPDWIDRRTARMAGE